MSIAEDKVLALPQFGEEFFLGTNASVKGLGAVLSQQIEGSKRVIAFASRSLERKTELITLRKS